MSKHRTPSARSSFAALLLQCLCVVLVFSPLAFSQSVGTIGPASSEKPISFMVATIKTDVSGAPAKGISVRGQTLIMTNTSLSDLIVFAYSVHKKQIIGGSDWVDKERYDITAVPDIDGQPSFTQWKTMVQTLLTERFQFKSHNDKKELSVYVLGIVKGGPKNLLKTASTGDGFSALLREVPGGFTLPMRNALISDFTNFELQGSILDRPVIDRTGIEGRHDFTLTWAVLGTEFGGAVLPPRSQPIILLPTYSWPSKISWD